MRVEHIIKRLLAAFCGDLILFFLPLKTWISYHVTRTHSHMLSLSSFSPVILGYFSMFLYFSSPETS